MPAYRIIHLVPEPLRPEQPAIPIAALLRHQGQVRVVRAPHLPGSPRLSEAMVGTMHRILTYLRSSRDFDRLPTSAGPHVSLSAVQSLPQGISDPARFLEATVLAHPPGQVASVYQEPTRAALGLRFFETYQVAQHVQRDFPPTLLNELPGETQALLPQASFWYSSREAVSSTGAEESAVSYWLLEPVAPYREALEQDLREISATFMAYRLVRPMLRHATIRLVAFCVPSHDRMEKDPALACLRPLADLIFDTTDTAECAQLLQIVESTPSLAA